jgi:hypothetical protein
MPRRDDKQGSQGAHNETPGTSSKKYQISLRRTGSKVEIELLFANEYASMEFYDSLVRSVSTGVLQFELALDQSQS